MSTTTTLPLPGFYDPGKVADTDRWVNYGALREAAVAYRKDHGLRPAIRDRKRFGVLFIDTQITFCHPQGELSVVGAVEDTQRSAEFILRNAGIISEVNCTLDTHRAYAVFHPSFFVGRDGKNAPPYTEITYRDVLDGKWDVNPFAASALGNSLPGMQAQLRDYTEKLEASGRYTLMVWPEHAMLGGKGYGLMPGMEEAAFFHSIARGSLTHFAVKGLNYYAENYSVFGPEVTSLVDGTQLQRDTEFFKKLMRCDYLAIGGQAKSHCVAWTIDDVLRLILAQDPELAKKIYLLEDCTSPVVTQAYDFTSEGNAAFDRFRDAGMHVVRSTDPIESWDGIEL